MNEQQNGPLLLLAFLEPFRLIHPSLDLFAFRAIEIEGLALTQLPAFQRIVCEVCHLYRFALPLQRCIDVGTVLALRQLGFQVPEVTKNEDVVRPSDRRTTEYQAAVRKGLKTCSGTVVGELYRCLVEW